MYCIIACAVRNYINLHIVAEEGEPILFGSRHSAEQYAKDYCYRNYKIVELKGIKNEKRL